MTIVLSIIAILLAFILLKPIQKYCVYEVSGHESAFHQLDSIKDKGVTRVLNEYHFKNGDIINASVKIYDSIEAAKLRMEFCEKYMNVKGAFYKLGCCTVLMPKYKYTAPYYHELKMEHLLTEKTWFVNE